MKLFIVSVLAVAAVADRLENTYLPPGSARTAGGNGNFLNAPFGGGNGGSPSRNYGAPGFGSSGSQRPSSQYGAPGFGSSGSQRPSSQHGAPGFGSSGSQRPSSQHGAPGSNGFQGPSSQYGAPGAGDFGQSPSGNYAGPSGSYAGQSGSSGRFGGVTQSREAGAAILRYNNENNGDGSYRFEYETENGISQQESGELKNAGSDYESSAVQGSYTYTGDDGQTYTVNYIADENGFQPFGEHIATISEAVQTSLKKNAAAEAQQGYQYNGQGSGAGNYEQGQGSGSGNYQQGGGYQGQRSGNHQQGGGQGSASGNYQQAGGHQGRGGNYQGGNTAGFNQQTGYQY